MPEHLTANLPLFLRQRYQFSRADLFGKKCILATENSRTGELTPTEYGRDVTQLRQRLRADVVLVLTKVPSYVRNRLVKQCVPFIVPGTQMFLPMLMIDLREQFPKSRAGTRPPLSAVSQLVVIYQILKGSLSDIPLGKVATRLGYSAMAMSKAQDELQTAQLCEVVRTGRTVSLQFAARGKALWEQAEPLLTTPVRRTQWIRWGQPRARAVSAGITALSNASMLTDDPIPTYAMRDRDLRKALEKGEIIGCGGQEEAEARLESWKYDPWILADNDIADRCSLYLSLRQSADERVQKEIRFLIEGLPQ
ncbi:MAG: hypothetical protein LAN84_01015 [Acidobacteriia bacterium]|nr:hypothetical protein [Terriglobia bacterium]